MERYQRKVSINSLLLSQKIGGYFEGKYEHHQIRRMVWRHHGLSENDGLSPALHDSEYEKREGKTTEPQAELSQTERHNEPGKSTESLLKGIHFVINFTTSN